MSILYFFSSFLNHSLNPSSAVTRMLQFNRLFSKVQRSMYKYRMTKIKGRRTFDTLDEFHAMLVSEENKHLLALDNGTIYADLIKAGDTTSLAFWDLEFVAQFKKSEILNIDATFKTIRFIGGKRKYQLLIVIAVIHNHVSLNIYINGAFQVNSTSPTGETSYLRFDKNWFRCLRIFKEKPQLSTDFYWASLCRIQIIKKILEISQGWVFRSCRKKKKIVSRFSCRDFQNVPASKFEAFISGEREY